MAAVKSDSNNVDMMAMSQSPLKLVEQTVNAASMRQRTGSTILSAGLHFKAPSKSGNYSSSISALEHADGGVLTTRARGEKLETSTDTAMLYYRGGFTPSTNKEQQKQVLLNNSNGVRVSNGISTNASGSSNASTPTTPAAASGAGDDSQHSSTSEYGSMADTHSTVSDSRLSSPQLARNASRTTAEWRHRRNRKEEQIEYRQHHHEKSPSWPEMYSNNVSSPTTSLTNGSAHYRSQSCWNAGGNGASIEPGAAADEAFTPSLSSTTRVDHYGDAPPYLDSEQLGGGDTSTLRRCSAQSMREICPKLLKKLQQPQQQQQQMQQYSRASMRDEAGDKGQQQQRRYYSPRREARVGLGGRNGGPLGSNDDEQDSSRILAPTSLMHSKSPSQISSSGSTTTTSDGSGADTPKEFAYENENGFGDGDHFYETAHESMNSKFGKRRSFENAVRRSASSENVIGDRRIPAGITARLAPRVSERGSYYHSTTIVSGYEQRMKNTVSSYYELRSTDHEEDRLRSPISYERRPTGSQESSPNARTSGRFRYQQRHQYKAPIQSSIRRKLQQAAADVAQAKSLPDLSGKGSANGSTINGFDEDVFRQFPEAGRKQVTVDDTLAYATSRVNNFTSASTAPALYAVPHKSNNHEQQQQLPMTKASAPPPPLPRRPPPPPPPTTTTMTVNESGNGDRINQHCRRASDSGLVQASASEPCTATEQANENSVAMIARKLFADQIRANSLSGISTTAPCSDGPKSSHKIFQGPPQAIQTTFPATAPNVPRRVVQVHPMCMNSSGDHQDLSIAHQGQSSSSSSSSSGQYSPPNTGMTPAHSPPTQNGDGKPSKPRPPVPKKPAKLSIGARIEPPVPARPPKPTQAELGNGGVDGFLMDGGDNGHILGFGQRENGVSAPTTNGASPFKQRKQLEDEEKCRELSNYVAQKSNDSSLKQILAPNQRCSVDYLEEYLANVRLSGVYGGENGDGKEPAQKNGFYANGSGRVTAHPVRTMSMESIDLEKEKIDLIARMSRKLKVLKEEQRAVEEEIRCNNELGASLFGLVDDSPSLTKQAKDRFRQFIVDTENITQLLLKLSAQLARMDNELNRGQSGDKVAKEKHQLLTERHQRIMAQLHDAKDLREDLDRRGDQIVAILRSIFTQEQLADYQYFIQMKYKLLLDAREIDDKIKLGEDQKHALEQSLSKV